MAEHDRRIEKSLETARVLVLDCQSTGATPAHGHLLEMAWCTASAEGPAHPGAEQVRAHLVALPKGAQVPPRISKLTGIQQSDLAAGLSPQEVWSRLARDAAALRADGEATAALTVVHFARFERPFLRQLHRGYGAGNGFPFDLVCTHEVACRLLPTLPRRGLRALSGYFGHVLGVRKRAAEHVLATVVVWRELVRRLGEQGVRSVSELRALLAAAAPSRTVGREYPLPRSRRLGLPDLPGVYRLLARRGEVLYLGKATSLRRRVNSYFQQQWRGDDKKLELLTQAFDVSVTVTESALEAALREADEIKRYQPPYNVSLRARGSESWFATTTFADPAPATDARRLLGPLPARDALDPLRRLVDALRRVGRSRPPGLGECRRMLRLPDRARLDVSRFRLGFERFRVRHGLRDPCPRPAVRVLRLGARLWRARRSEDADASEPDADPLDEAERRRWDPEQITKALETAVLRGAHLVRRAHWLCQLSESCLAWAPATAAAGERRLLVIEGGRVIERTCLSPGSPVPIPPGHARVLAARRGSFDAATHDRLRVLTTEIRRLVADGREVELRLGPRRSLGRRALARRLSWV